MYRKIQTFIGRRPLGLNMANNPQARNLPTIRFTKRVGQAPLKNMVQSVIENSIHHLCYDLDLSECVLDVLLTRAQGPTRGSMGYAEGVFEGKPNLNHMQLLLNIGSMTNARDEGELIKTLMHEVIHFAQMQHGILMGEVVRGARGRKVWQTSFNVSAGYELSRRIQGAGSLLFERPISWQQGDRVDTLVKASPRRNYNAYLMQPHERQAWRGVLGMAKNLYPQALEAARESIKTSVKGCKERGRIWDTRTAITSHWAAVPTRR